MRISDWSSDVCSSDLVLLGHATHLRETLGLIHGSLEPAGPHVILLDEEASLAVADRSVWRHVRGDRGDTQGGQLQELDVRLGPVERGVREGCYTNRVINGAEELLGSRHPLGECALVPRQLHPRAVVHPDGMERLVPVVLEEGAQTVPQETKVSVVCERRSEE